MADFDDNMRGVLFVNDKGDNEKRPDYRGTINVNGEEFELAGWKRTSAKGVKFLSLSVSEKQERASGPAGHSDNQRLYGKGGKADHARAASHDGFEDSDIPFAQPACLDGLCFPNDGAWFGPTLTDYSK